MNRLFLFSLFVAGVSKWFDVSFYQIATSISSLTELYSIPSADILECVRAYEYLVENSNSTHLTNTEEETRMVQKYYSVVQSVLAIADIEKMYIPPSIDASVGVYGNQILLEKQMVEALDISEESKVLDMGCGRGRVAYHVAQQSGAHVSGFNIDRRQIRHAKTFAHDRGMDSKLSFQVGDFQKPFPYKNNSFDASYDMQAIWAFTKKKDLRKTAGEIYRTLKPGGRFFSNTYTLTSAFNHSNPKHSHLHSLFLPTLAATQSNYHYEIEYALQAAGFEIKWSHPSIAPAWPLTDQKTFLFESLLVVVKVLNKVGVLPREWLLLIENLLKGGVAWKMAEQAKLADLCWQIVVQKPF